LRREEAPELVEGAPEAVALTEQHLAESGDPPDVRTAAVETTDVIRHHPAPDNNDLKGGKGLHTRGHRVDPRMQVHLQTLQTPPPPHKPPPPPNPQPIHTVHSHTRPHTHTPGADEEQEDHDDPFAGVRIRHGAMQGPKGLGRRGGGGGGRPEGKRTLHQTSRNKQSTRGDEISGYVSLRGVGQYLELDGGKSLRHEDRSNDLIDILVRTGQAK